MNEDDLSLSNLSDFRGSEGYFNLMGFNATDGIGYIMKNGYSWFVTDFIAVAKFNEKIKNEEFVCIKLVIDKDTKKCFMLVTDGNENELYKQDYDYTNAQKDLTLYLTDGVLLLSQEY